MRYAPEPPFNSGTPETAPASVLATMKKAASAITEQRRKTAERVAAKL